MPKLERPLPKLATVAEKLVVNVEDLSVEKSVKKEKKGKVEKGVKVKKETENDKENVVDGEAEKVAEEKVKPLDIVKTVEVDQIGQYWV